MFSSFFNKKDTPASSTASAATPVVTSVVESDDEENGSDDVSNFELTAELGGGKGWPTDATCILYHRIQGLICVGTAGGAIFVYGDGFQFMRPWLTSDANEVTAITALHHNRIIVCYSDNSLVVMELPTLDIIDLFSGSWLDRKSGDISVVQVDGPGEKNFTYIGTSEGVVLVLDVMEGSIRHCDFKLTWSDLGVGQSMMVADIQVCPKDDRYLSIGFAGAKGNQGAIVIYDLVKNKVHKTFKTAAITSMDWSCSGDVLYAGTRLGEILGTGLDKSGTVCLWNAKVERCDECDDDNVNEDGDAAVTVRRLYWLAPQTNSPDGCLFAALAMSDGDQDTLKSVIVGLSPSSSGDMSMVFSLPPMVDDKVVRFKIVPTYEKEDKSSGVVAPSTDVAITPALLLLTERQVDDKPHRQLKIVRCPCSPVSEWALEIGTTPDPRRATEVLPSAAEITCMSGFAASTQSKRSLSVALAAQMADTDGKLVALSTPDQLDTIHTPTESDRRVSRRISTRDFLHVNDLELQLSDAEKWEMVLASGLHQEVQQKSKFEGVSVATDHRLQDIIVKGHADGTVIAWGVSLPSCGRELGRGNVWLPYRAFRCGTAEVHAIAHDESNGLLAAGDESGQVVLWETYSTLTGVGTSDILQEVKENTEDNSQYEDTTSSHSFVPNDFREVLRFQVHAKVTSILILASMLTLIVGTEDGTIWYSTNFSQEKGKELTRLEKVDKKNPTGPVLAFCFNRYLIYNSLVPVVYSYYESGHLAVIELSSMSYLAYNTGVTLAGEQGSDNTTVLDGSICLAVVNYMYTPLEEPSLQIITSSVSAAAAAAVHAFASKPVVAPSTPDAVPVETPKQSRMSTMFSTSRQRSQTSPMGPSSATAGNSSGPLTPATPSSEDAVSSESHHNNKEHPRYVMLIRGKALLTYDLSRLSSATPGAAGSANKAGKSSSMWSSVQAAVATHTAMTSRNVSQRTLVCSKLLSYTLDNDGDEYSLSNKLHCFACINVDGLYVVVSLKSRAAVSHVHLLEGVVETDTSGEPLVRSGLVLTNGNCYFSSTTKTIVYSATTQGPTIELTSPLPTRASPLSNAPDKSLWLLHGREAMLAQLKSTLKKRRSSVINISAAPTDLYKIFSKSKEVKHKDELLEGHTHKHHDDEDSGAKSSNRNATKTTATMNEVKQNFEERGQRLNQIAQKMDNFKASASQYRDTVKEQKEQLKKKNARWGLF